MNTQKAGRRTSHNNNRANNNTSKKKHGNNIRNPSAGENINVKKLAALTAAKAKGVMR